MRFDFRNPRSTAGAFGAVAIMAMLAVVAHRAHANPCQGMPLIFPQQSLFVLPQFNPTTQFSVLRQSQVLIAQTGAVAQTALVDMIPQRGVFNPAGQFPLVVPAQDVLLVQQLNQGAVIQPQFVFPVPSGQNGAPALMAQVNIQQVDNRLSQIGPLDFLLVCPAQSLPTLAQLNPRATFNVLRFSQFVAGNFAPVTQTALVAVRQPGIINLAQPFPMYVPTADLSALFQFNIGTPIGVINTFQAVVGTTGQVRQVSLVHFAQSNAANDRRNNPGGSAGQDNNRGEGAGNNTGNQGDNRGNRDGNRGDDRDHDDDRGRDGGNRGNDDDDDDDDRGRDRDDDDDDHDDDDD